MTPPISIGSHVEIIGEAFGEISQAIGECGKITEISERMNYRVSGLWYPASSLRLVPEELKIGDWVEVIGPNECGGEKWIGQTFQISTTHKEAPSFRGRELFSALNMGWFEASSLRKLTPEEIAKHTRPTKEDLARVETQFRVVKCEERLSAIEKRLDAQKDAIIEMNLRLDVDAEDIKALEGERPEVCDCRISHLEAQRDYILSHIADDMMLLLDENFIVDGKMRSKEHVWLGELESVNERLDSMKEG
jgi:hypothetical protein